MIKKIFILFTFSILYNVNAQNQKGNTEINKSKTHKNNVKGSSNKVKKHNKNNIVKMKYVKKKEKKTEQEFQKDLYSKTLGLRASLDMSSGIGFSGYLFTIFRPNPFFFIMPELGYGFFDNIIKFGGKQYGLSSQYAFGNFILGIKPVKYISIYFGPSVNYSLKFNYRLENENDTFFYTYDNVGVSIISGIGTSINGFYIDFRYEYIVKGDLELDLKTIDGEDKTIKTKFFENNIKICLGYFLF